MAASATSSDQFRPMDLRPQLLTLKWAFKKEQDNNNKLSISQALSQCACFSKNKLESLKGRKTVHLVSIRRTTMRLTYMQPIRLVAYKPQWQFQVVSQTKLTIWAPEQSTEAYRTAATRETMLWGQIKSMPRTLWWPKVRNSLQCKIAQLMTMAAWVTHRRALSSKLILRVQDKLTPLISTPRPKAEHPSSCVRAWRRTVSATSLTFLSTLWVQASNQKLSPSRKAQLAHQVTLVPWREITQQRRLKLLLASLWLPKLTQLSKEPIAMSLSQARLSIEIWREL